MIPANAEWQMVGQDEWVFGEKIRGVVRSQLAELYYNEDSDHPAGGWIWLLLGKAYKQAKTNGKPTRGVSGSLSAAVWDAEEAMGIV